MTSRKALEQWLAGVGGTRERSVELNSAGGRFSSLVAQFQMPSGTSPEHAGSALRGLTALHPATPGTENSLATTPFALKADSVASQTSQLAVHTPVGQRGWSEEVGNRLTWMIGRGESKAELVLTPPSLGKVEVSINLTGEQATAHFVAASRDARDALEQAMPRLRELMQQAGISLGDTQVGTRQGNQGQSADDSPARRGSRTIAGNSSGDISDAGAISAGTTRWTGGSNGLVDTFA